MKLCVTFTDHFKLFIMQYNREGKFNFFPVLLIVLVIKTREQNMIFHMFLFITLFQEQYLQHFYIYNYSLKRQTLKLSNDF